MNIKIKGPKINGQKAIWDAGFDGGDVEVIEFLKDDGHFDDHRAIRHLFLGRNESVLNATDEANRRRLLLPGTMIALCRINGVRVNLDSSTYKWKQTDDRICHAVLLLHANPKDWIEGASPNQRLKAPECLCVGGEIDLSTLEPQNGDSWNAQFPKISNAKDLKLNSGGLAFEGECRFLWDAGKRFPAAFWTAPFYDRESIAGPRHLYLTIDRERMKAEGERRPEWRKSLVDLASAFQDFGSKLKQTGTIDEAENYWTSLELVTKGEIPRFSWKIAPQTRRTTLNFDRGEWQVLVSDQRPGESDVTPRGLLTIAPEIEVTEGPSQGDINVKFLQLPPGVDQFPDAQMSAMMTFSADKSASGWTETAAVTNLVTEYESLLAADILRRQYQLPAVTDEDEADPPILWGFLPLANGWAQLPFLNVVEQHYFDAIGKIDKSHNKDTSPVVVGSAVFGNDAPETYLPAAGENPWSITLVGGTGYQGVWLVRPNPANAGKLELVSRKLEISSPDMVLNGFLNLGTQTPTVADSLPSLDNFLANIGKVTLRTVIKDDQFPSPFRLSFSSVKIKNRSTTRENRRFSDPSLQDWQFIYSISNQVAGNPAERLLEVLLKKGLWKDLPETEQATKLDEVWSHAPLVWRRHPNIPLVQAMPLTQTQMPPSYPSPSRQLAPFEFQVDPALPGSPLAIFGVDDATGGRDWPRWLNPRQVDEHQDWGKKKFLYLASLDLPGLIYDPAIESSLLQTTDDFLPTQILYSLAYTDEINALAQLPKDEKEAAAIAINKDIAPVKPAVAPRREHLEEHWRILAEKAALAKADADKILHKTSNGKTVVRHLIEPFDWVVRATLEADSYPAKILLTDDDNGRAVELSKESALKGISGTFDLVGNNLRRSDDASATGFKVLAQSLEAHGDGSRVRDQRGLYRGLTKPLPNTGPSRLFKTALERQTASGSDLFSLCTLMEPVTLELGGAASWQFWFRDLPVFDSDNSFTRIKTLVAPEDVTPKLPEDVNDTAAYSSKKNALNGYEWRLGQNGRLVNLFGFNFFPLTIEKLKLVDENIESLEIFGRLQLPIEGEVEFPENGNVVRVVFQLEGGTLKLASINSDLGAGSGDVRGIWNLNPKTERFAPRLHWKKLSYPASGSTPTTKKIALSGGIEFYLFDARWFVAFDDVSFEPGSDVTLVSAGTAANSEIRFEKVTLKFDAGLKPIAIKVEMRFDWGKQSQVTFGAAIIFDLLKSDAKSAGANLLDNAESIELFLQMDGIRIPLETDGKRSSLTRNALQIEFERFTDYPADLELLPGMNLVGKESCGGFAAAAFSITQSDALGSRFSLDYGAIETVFDCRWGRQMVSGATSSQDIFASSSGSICAGLTLSGSGDSAWKTSLLLNGLVEINNLLSYPRIEKRLVVEGKPTIDLPDFILFESESTSLTQEAITKLDALAEFLKKAQYSNLHLSVEGHTDSTGNHSDGEWDNVRYSKERAKAVKDRLISGGVNANRLQTVGFGETLPRDTNGTPEGMANNRRVEIHPSLTFLPSSRATSENLNHVRHSLRVLLNQHEIPSEALVAGGTDSLIFKFADAAGWQFLAVAEHCLADVKFSGEPFGAVPEVTNLRRWAAVQEVRLTSAKKLSDYLTEVFHQDSVPEKDRLHGTFPAHTRLETKELSRVSVAFHHKPFLKRLLKKTGGQDEITRLGNVLFVEASSIHQVLSHPVQSDEMTNLQYLPNGIQQASLSLANDYTIPDVSADWFLLSMPFLGRLQNASNDWLLETVTSPPNASAFAVDPIWLISRKRRTAGQPLPILPLVLASRGDDSRVEVKVSLFDLARFRRFRRLDQPTLMESWFRLQNPPRERTSDTVGLQSITATLAADAPARLSRQNLLDRLFDSVRESFPPTLSDAATGSGLSVTEKLMWRAETQLTCQGFSNLIEDSIDDEANGDRRPYSFYFAAAQLQSALFTGDGLARTRYPAVTLLPAHLDSNGNRFDSPVSFSVSPYLGLEFRKLNNAAETLPRLVVAELLCLENAGKKLLPTASRIWNREEINDDFENLVKKWAGEIKNRIASDSAIAIVRVRLAFAVGQTGDDRSLKIAYRFFTIPSSAPNLLTVGDTGPLRMSLDKLRFSQGQFGGFAMPADFSPVEVAPPQVSGAQPIYIDVDAWNSTKPVQVDKWFWGLSAMRISVNYTLQKAGLIGEYLKPGDTEKRHLWWNAISHRVQFAQPPEIAALLPVNFRERQVRSLLVVSPRLPLPGNLARFLEGDDQSRAMDANLCGWQPVLPGSLNYLVLGARSGVPFVFRNMLLRQDANHPDHAELSAGGVPVQHRFPRPVILPKYPADIPVPQEPAPKYALQTWASFFQPHRLLRNYSSPQDNAFVVKGEKEAHGLQIDLTKPSSGICPQTEIDGFEFAVQGKPASEDIQNWHLEFRLTAGDKQLDLMQVFWPNDFKAGIATLISKLRDTANNKVSAYLREKFSETTRQLIDQYVAPAEPTADLLSGLAAEFDGFLKDPALYEDDRFSGIVLRERTKKLKIGEKWGVNLLRFSRAAIEDAFPEIRRGQTNLRLIPAKSFEENATGSAVLKEFFTGLSHGEPLLLSATTIPPTEITSVSDYSQTLSFPLRFAHADRTLDPLRYEFIQFEDPEFNRRLVSQAALSNRNVIVDNQRTIEQILAADRREYNASSDVLVAFFSELVTPGIDPPAGPIRITRVDIDGNQTTVAESSMQSFRIISLSKIEGLMNGDSILISFTPHNTPGRPIEIRVEIVAEPVTPVPTAAYALLRKKLGEATVECVRFAWSPQPTRIELLNPADLKSGIVRRRAVFQWQDTVRRSVDPGGSEVVTNYHYALQKITPSGSTHFPDIP